MDAHRKSNRKGKAHMTKQSIAVLGLGTMGSRMAINLLKAGFSLSVYNRTVAKMQPLAELGARVASSPADAAKGRTLLLRCWPMTEPRERHGSLNAMVRSRRPSRALS
jgi:shikimate 5-dehydrogenase